MASSAGLKRLLSRFCPAEGQSALPLCSSARAASSEAQHKKIIHAVICEETGLNNLVFGFIDCLSGPLLLFGRTPCRFMDEKHNPGRRFPRVGGNPGRPSGITVEATAGICRVRNWPVRQIKTRPSGKLLRRLCGQGTTRKDERSMYPTRKNADQEWGITKTVRPWLGASAAALGLGIFCQNASAQFYAQSNLVSDVSGVAAVTDTILAGAWGTTHTPTSPWWVNTTASGLSLLFNGQGQPLPLVVAIPPTNPATATGITANSGTGFQVELNLPAVFIFATLNGTISGWNPHQANPQLAVLEVDNSGK